MNLGQFDDRQKMTKGTHIQNCQSIIIFNQRLTTPCTTKWFSFVSFLNNFTNGENFCHLILQQNYLGFPLFGKWPGLERVLFFTVVSRLNKGGLEPTRNPQRRPILISQTVPNCLRVVTGLWVIQRGSMRLGWNWWEGWLRSK